MAFKDPNVGLATQFKPGTSGNLAGAPKGSKHITTHIQEMLEDETFEANILDAKTGVREYKGAPIKAIIQVATIKAVNGDEKAREWLAKYGWSQKLQLGNDPDNPLTNPSAMSREELEDAVRDIIGSAAQGGGTVHPSIEPPQGS